MKIAILGAGNVGGALGRALAAAGHEVVFGVRDASSPKTQAALSAASGEGAQIPALDILEAVAASEVVALTIPWPAAEAVLGSVPDWAGKVLIDATNRFAGGASGLSAGEDAARLARGARVVKAFNTIGAEHLVNPMFGGEAASMLICGDDADAKQTAGGLAREIGFDVVDAGPLANARLLESLAQLWVSLTRGGMGREIAFRLVRR